MLHIPGFRKFCSSRNLTSGRNNGERNEQLLETTPRDNALLKISNDAPIQDGWPTDPITTQIVLSRCDLKMFWLFLAAILSLAISLYAYGIKHVFTYFKKRYPTPLKALTEPSKIDNPAVEEVKPPLLKKSCSFYSKDIIVITATPPKTAGWGTSNTF